MVNFQVLGHGQVGPRGLSGIGGDHDFLRPGRAPEVFAPLPKQRVFGVAVGSPLAPEQGAVHREAVDGPRRQEDTEPNKTSG